MPKLLSAILSDTRAQAAEDPLGWLLVLVLIALLVNEVVKYV